MAVDTLWWSASWSNTVLVREQGAKLLAHNGTLEGGSLTRLGIEVSFPRSLACNSSQCSSQHSARMTLDVGRNRTVEIRLNTKPGSLSAKESRVNGPVDGSVVIGEPAQYRIVTRDKYGQTRTKSVPRGSLKLTVADSDGRETCAAECYGTKELCNGKKCCCFDRDDGTYLAIFDTKHGAEANKEYTIEILAKNNHSQTPIPMPLANGNGDSFTLRVVKPKGTKDSLCDNVTVSLSEKALVPYQNVSIGPPQGSETSMLVSVPKGIQYNNLRARLIPLAGTINKPINHSSLSTKVLLSATGMPALWCATLYSVGCMHGARCMVRCIPGVWYIVCSAARCTVHARCVWCTMRGAICCMVHAGEYQLDLASDGESCVLVPSFTVNCTAGYSKQGPVCAEVCSRGKPAIGPSADPFSQSSQNVLTANAKDQRQPEAAL